MIYQFVLQRPILNTGGQLLPDLIKAYNWLHDHLAYTLTVKDAQTKTLIQVLEDHTANFRDKRLEVLQRFESVLGTAIIKCYCL